MNNEELLCEKEYKPFKVFIYTQPEDIDVAEMFDKTEDDIDELRADINKGNKIWVMARAVAYCKGVELGGASIGGLHYDSYEDLKKDILKDEKRHILFAEQAVERFRTYKPIKHLLYSVLEKKDLFQRNINQRFEKLNNIIANVLLRVSSVVLGLLVQSIKKKVSLDQKYPDLDSAFSRSNDMY